MRYDIVAPRELGESELARWRALQHPNPFMSAEFVLAAGRFRPCARVAVLSDDTGIAGFFPYERHALEVGRPIGAGLTDCQGFIGAPGLAFDPRALLRACRLAVWEFDHLLAEQTALVPYHTETRTQPIADLSAGFDAYAEQIQHSSPTVIKRIRRQERRLGHRAGELTYTFGERDPVELRRLMDWKSAQYRDTGRRNPLALPWVTALVKYLHHTGTARLGVLRAGDRPVAYNLCLRNGGVLAGWFTAYDTNLGKYSPGMIGHLRLAEAAAAHGVTEIDMGRGGRKYKDWLKNGEFSIAEGRLARASAVAALHWAISAPVRHARSVVLANPRWYARADRFLKSCARLRPLGGGR